jgi:site-specific recombinase XerD
MAATQTNPKHALAHYRLYLYVQLMSFSGMRVSEAKNLRFSDTGLRNVQTDTEHFTIWVRGKGKSRNVVTFRNCEAIIDRFRSIAKMSAKKNEWEFSEDTFVLSNEDGKPIGSHSVDLHRNLTRDLH